MDAGGSMVASCLARKSFEANRNVLAKIFHNQIDTLHHFVRLSFLG